MSVRDRSDCKHSLQIRIHTLPIHLGFHVDKIDHDNSADTNLNCRTTSVTAFDVGLQNGFAEITLSDESTGIYIDGRQSLRLINDQITAAAGQPDLT